MIESDKSGDAFNHHLKDFSGGSGAADQTSAPIGTYPNECPIINIAEAANPSPSGEAYEAPRLTYLGTLAPGELRAARDEIARRRRSSSATLIAHVVPAATRPGELSLRLRPTDRSWRAFLEALEAEGFKAGDVVRIEAVRS